MFNVNDRVMVVINTVKTDTDANKYVGHTGKIIEERKYSSFRWQVEFDDAVLKQKAFQDDGAWKNDELILLDSDNKNYVR